MKNCAVMGATGQIGHVLVEELLKFGHTVRALGRDMKKLKILETKGAKVYPVVFEDARALSEAFQGTDAVFSLLPPSYGADDFGAYQDKVGEAIVAALTKTKVSRVLNLSSLGANVSKGAGPVNGLHRHETRLNQMQGLNVLHLRPGYFMENLFWSIPLIKAQGINGGAIRGDIPIGMVATQDIARKAAELLHRLEFVGNSVYEFVGPKEITLEQATACIGKAIGKPDLKYVTFSYEDARQGMFSSGMKASITGLLVEMAQAFNEGRIRPTQPLTPDHKGPTSFDGFAKGIAEAYQSG